LPAVRWLRERARGPPRPPRLAPPRRARARLRRGDALPLPRSDLARRPPLPRLGGGEPPAVVDVSHDQPVARRLGVLVGHVRHPVAAFHWSFDAIRNLLASQRPDLEREVLARPPGATVCVPTEPAPLTLGFPGSVGIFMLYHRDDALEGRRVYFVSSDPGVLAMREQGGRLRGLLLPAGHCPPSAG